MVGPARRREAVVHVQQTLETSERRACRSLKQPRSTQRYRSRKPESDKGLFRAIQRIASREPRAGYRTVARYLKREGWSVNIKRIHRLWKQEGMKVPAKARKRRRLGGSANGTQRLRASRLNEVWSYDFVHDQTETGRRLKWLPVLDEHSRECLALEVGYSMTAQDVVATLQRLVAQRGAPTYIRSDNGPEFVSTAVKDWLQEAGIGTLYIEPGAPWQNAYSESFNSRFRDEFLNLELFGNQLEAKVLGKEYQQKYNHQRPHSALGNLTPGEFAARCHVSLRPFDFVEAACATQDSATHPIIQPILS